jgi:hypothetical protein
MWMPELSLEIEKAVQAAVEEEREACAKIAREEAGRIKRASGFHFSTCRESQAAHGTATGIEEEIRARSEKNGQA